MEGLLQTLVKKALTIQMTKKNDDNNYKQKTKQKQNKKNISN